MHSWGQEDVDWKGIGDAAWFIASNLKRWGRVPVRDWKEKWGTVRVYCSLGWYSIHDITHPGHAWIRYPRNSIRWHLNSWNWFNQYVMGTLNRIVVPYHMWLYTYLYGRALRKWPHLRLEILSGADHHELLQKYGVHCIRESENGYRIEYDWSPNDYKYPPHEETEDETITAE